MILLGISNTDDLRDLNFVAEKCAHLRIFGDDQGKMNRSLLDVGGALAVVSQFTLFGDCRNGRRPFYGAAARPEIAKPLVARVVEAARELGCPVVEGRFQAAMRVSLVNEGPVTLLLDTDEAF